MRERLIEKLILADRNFEQRGLKGYWEHIADYILADGKVAEALEKQIPKKPDYEHHEWLKDKDGNIDEWAYDVGFHNGPICQRCGHFFCVNCVKDYEAELNSPCGDSYYKCPTCGNRVSRLEHHCECGQRLDWRDNV